MPNDFANARALLVDLRIAFGNQGLVGMSMNEEFMVITHSRPDTGKPMIQMTFDTEGDFERDRSELIAEFAAYSEDYYSSKLDI